jgi:hypothetical protein
MGKTLLISNNTHIKLKEYCNNNSIKLNNWVDSVILKKLEEMDELQKNI